MLTKQHATKKKKKKHQWVNKEIYNTLRQMTMQTEPYKIYGTQ